MPRYFRGDSLLLNSSFRGFRESKMQSNRLQVSLTTAGLRFAMASLKYIFCWVSSVKVPLKDLFSGERVVEREPFCCSQKVLFISDSTAVIQKHSNFYNFGAPLEEREENSNYTNSSRRSYQKEGTNEKVSSVPYNQAQSL